MKRIFFAAALLAAAMPGVIRGLEAELGRIDRWKSNASGSMSRTYDSGSRSLRFSVAFPPGADRWAYPIFQLDRQTESLAGVDFISFEWRAEQSGADAGYRCAYLMLDGIKKNLPLPEPGRDWRLVEVDLRPCRDELAKATAIRIGMNPQSDKLQFELRNFSLKPKGKAQKSRDVAAALSCSAPGTVFVAGEPLRFTRNDTGKVRFILRDFYGERVREGEFPDGGELILETLPTGYYTIALESGEIDYQGERSFTVVADPAAHRRNPESPFAVDTALSWLARADKSNPRFPGDASDLVIELLRRGSISSIRERLSWRGVQAGPAAELRFGEYLANAEKLRRTGINILGLFHDSPPWSNEAGNPALPPDDLLALYRFTGELGKGFQGAVTAWEYWNEADHHSHRELPWSMAAAQKAAYLGFKAGNAGLNVLQGSFCNQPLPEYAACFMENDAAYYFDIFNYHSYRPLARYPEIVEDLRGFMRRFGIGNMPVYLTETGTNSEGESVGQSFHPRYRETSAMQDRLLAEFAVKSAITYHSLGVARSYFFVLPPYNEREGRKDWGVLRRDYSAKPQFAALSTLARLLDRARCLGEYDLGAGKRGFLFEQPDRSITLVFWAESALDLVRHDSAVGDVPIPESFFSLGGPGMVALTDIVGTRKQVPRGRIPVSRYPAYAEGLSGLAPTRPAGPLGTPGALTTDKDLAVVVNPSFRSGFSVDRSRTLMLATAPSGSVVLDIFNLSGEEKTGTLDIRGVNVRGVPETLALKPMSRQTVTFECSFEGAQTVLDVGGRFNGREISRCRVRLRSRAALEQAAGIHLEARLPERWRSNTSGKMTVSQTPAGDAVIFKVDFGSGDKWMYPEYTLAQPAESMEKASAVRFEWRGSGACREANLMLVDETGKAEVIKVENPRPEWRTETIQLPSSGKKIKLLRLGVNPLDMEYELQVRSVEILRLTGTK